MANYEYDENKMSVRINCLGYLYGASIEDFQSTMERVMDVLLEVKKVNTIILAKEREYEYGPDQTKMLVEIASIIEDSIRQGIFSVVSSTCLHYYNNWPERIREIALDRMRKDPIGAYVELLREIRELKMKMKNTNTRMAYNCYKNFIVKILDPLKVKLEATKLIRLAKPHISGHHVGDRTLYRQVFMPIIRPNFMLTRYMIMPPKGGISLDRYMVGDTEVEIFKLPKKTENFYHVVPPEFKLEDDKYVVIDEARRYMATHKPKNAEFVGSTKIREIFYNIGRDMIRETAAKARIKLTYKDVEQLAAVLTRYTAGFGILEVLLADQKLQDIYVNSPIEKQPILVSHENWGECRTNIIPTMEDAEAWATRLRIQSGRPLDESNPVLDTDLAVPGGSARFAVITRTLSPQGLGFAIRRHRDRPWTLPLFIKNRFIDPLAAGLFSFLIDGSVSLLVAGGRSGGKTSFLGSLMLEILPKTRIVTIEDTLELPIQQLLSMGYNIASLKSRSVITNVETEMKAEEALRTALRLGDSAMIIGEVRSTEAKALYESMRIGALSNVVAGTIHGESAYGVYDRVVNDLDVPSTSFKATDIIPVCKNLRSADGLHKFRRVTEVAEVRKEWETSPLKEGGFVNLMEYSSKEDKLKPTDVFLNGESEILNRIASYVKEWDNDWSVVWENIKLRGRIKEMHVTLAEKLKNPEILEARIVVLSNQIFHKISENVSKEIGIADPERVYNGWYEWMKEYLKGKSTLI
ncbi:MAG: type II/IV secretion system ATPase subunit [Candidatus Aenigmatarchaeota archaeon]|nr:type II/IV secretion system ATPase subunit [Nanoarchaeota archaeon]